MDILSNKEEASIQAFTMTLKCILEITQSDVLLKDIVTCFVCTDICFLLHHNPNNAGAVSDMLRLEAHKSVLGRIRVPEALTVPMGSQR